MSTLFQVCLGTLLLLLSVSHRYSFGINVLELVGAFAHFGCLFYGLVFLLSVWKRLFWLGGLMLIASLHAAILVSPAFSYTELSSKKPDITVVQANLWHKNSIPEEAIQAIADLDADIVSFQEANANWSETIEQLLKVEYPYFIENPHNQCCYGISVYSKYPITKHEIIHLEGIPAILAQIQIADSTLVNVCSFHALAPVFPNETSERNNQLESLSNRIRKSSLPSLILGDFNVVTWDPTFTSFERSSAHTRLDCGLQPTFPMDFGVPLIPIDHILYSEQLTPASCSSVDIPGSDHRGLTASFSIKE